MTHNIGYLLNILIFGLTSSYLKAKRLNFMEILQNFTEIQPLIKKIEAILIRLHRNYVT